MKDLLVKINPTFTELTDAQSKSIAEGRLLILLARCSVEYSGRSASKLGSGDRIVIVKPDRSVLVHRRAGRDAVNWQPPGSVIKIQTSDHSTTLRAFRPRQRETLLIRLEEVYLVASMKPTDDARLEMLLTEKELYQVIASHPELIEEGLRIASAQRVVGEGVADFSARDSRGNYVVIEVKKDPVSPDAVKQLYGYVAALRQNPLNVRGILLGPSISKAARSLLSSLKLEFRQIDLKKCAALLQEAKEEHHENLDRHLSKDYSH